MPLQNRVDPFGNLFADRARGTLMGSRGGRIHSDNKRLTKRRWASKQWICCVLDFKGRQRDVWGRYYTELFFLDEPTALAAGHRPCFECRRKDAEEFARLAGGLRAGEMDDLLQKQRLDGRDKRTHRLNVTSLPDGAFVSLRGEPYAVRDNELLRWTPKGYDKTKARPRSGKIDVLTPPLMLKALRGGYAPRWHHSAR
ncbi:MAG: hypothetical protein JO254_03685 [Pseudolabrys sp.]|nr:hypothetical protein [Pseudolabrys sp.]